MIVSTFWKMRIILTTTIPMPVIRDGATIPPISTSILMMAGVGILSGQILSGDIVAGITVAYTVPGDGTTGVGTTGAGTTAGVGAGTTGDGTTGVGIIGAGAVPGPGIPVGVGIASAGEDITDTLTTAITDTAEVLTDMDSTIPAGESTTEMALPPIISEVDLT